MKTCKEGNQRRLAQAALFQRSEGQRQFLQVKTDVS